MASVKDTNKSLATLQSEAETAIGVLRQIMEQVEELKDAQQECFDNMPEGLQQTEKGQSSELRAEQLESIQESLDTLISDFDDIGWTVE